MENGKKEIVISEEFLDSLPKNVRNAVKALRAHPDGLLSTELCAITGAKSASSSCKTKADYLAQNGLKIEQLKSHKGSKSLWILREIEPIQQSKVLGAEEPNEESDLKIGDTVWYISCPQTSPQIDLVDPTRIRISHALVGDLWSLMEANSSKCYKSYDEAADAFGAQYAKLLRCK